MEQIQQILQSEDRLKLRTLFSFNNQDLDEVVLFKFNLWARWGFPKYFTSPDAPFHQTIDENNLMIYRSKILSFINVAFRGAAKTARTKLFLAFCILNDNEHYRRYFKVIAEDGVNSQQIVTDIYNMMVSPKITFVYPDVLGKTITKREETMGSFTTSTGIKVMSGIVGSDQRGAIQEDARPDFIWFEDFENRKTLRSIRKTMAIWENMEEARTSLAREGGAIYTCNYISEQGNVHKLITKTSAGRKVLIVPIENGKGELAWSRYSRMEVEQMRIDDDDFEGERLCKPSSSKDIMFDRESLDNMKIQLPIKESNGFKIYATFDPSHRYASGHDIAGGVGLDSSTSVFIDFSTIPAQVVGVYNNNFIKPEVFGHEIAREAAMFGNCLVAPERNYGAEAILVLKQLRANIFIPPQKDAKVVQGVSTEYGWQTNALTKPKMLFALGKAIEDGLLQLNDESLIRECKAYTRNDLLETIKDPRLTTRHFDLLISVAIAWQMRNYAFIAENEEKEYAQAVDNYLNTLKGTEQEKVWSDNHFDKYFI